MADTVNAFQIGTDWTDLNLVSSIDVGSAVALQAVGGPGDIIELAIQDLEPPEDFKGIRLWESGNFYYVDAGENRIWGRYRRIDRIVTATSALQIQVLT